MVRPSHPIPRQALWLIGLGVVLILLGSLARADWIGPRDLARLLRTMLSAAGVIVLVTIPFVIHQPGMSLGNWLRLSCGLMLTFVALKVGSRYVHLCLAGSRVVEGGAFLGTPLLVGVILLATRGRNAAFVVCCALVLILYLGSRPYLDWAHGQF